MRNWLRDFYQRNGSDQRFQIEDMLAPCKMDKERTSDYQAAAGFLGDQRKKFLTVLDAFFGSPDYKKHLEDGMEDTEMFSELVASAVSMEIYPVISDAAKNPGSKEGYRLYTLNDFKLSKERRMRSLANEVGTFVPAFQKLVSHFPELAGSYQPPALPGFDGALRRTCEECGAIFVSQTNLVAHHLRKHVGEAA